MVSYIIIKGVAKELNSLEREEALKHEQRLNRLPLGKLLGEGNKFGIFSRDLFDRLQSFNKERRWIVHNSIRESGERLYTDEGRTSVFLRIEGFVKEAMSLHKHIGELIVEYTVNKGMNKELIYQKAENHIRKLEGEN